jgi:hypothetical protein
MSTFKEKYIKIGFGILDNNIFLLRKILLFLIINLLQIH